jgi:hypothetical protein
MRPHGVAKARQDHGTPSVLDGISVMPPMTEKPPRSSQLKTAASEGDQRDKRMPTNEELLYELRKHGAKPPPSRPLPAVSRRTRDYLLLASIGSAVIGFVAFRLVGGSDAAVALRLALTGVGLFCGLLWFIFYGVMSRY